LHCLQESFLLNTSTAAQRDAAEGSEYVEGLGHEFESRTSFADDLAEQTLRTRRSAAVVT
jgi:hypothetical protein